MRKFIFWSVFVVLVAVVAYILFGNPGSVPAPTPGSTAIEEPAEEPATEAPEVTFSTRAVTADEMGRYETTVSINGTIADILSHEAPVETKVFRKMATATYVGVYPSELGGYINFGGPFELYRATADGALAKIIPSFGITSSGFFTDISADEAHVAYFDYNEDYTAMRLHIVAVDGSSKQSFSIPAPYSRAGDAFFSPDGSKVVFTATCGDPEAECGVVYIVNLTTEAMEILPGSIRTGEFLRATGWVDNNNVRFYDGAQNIESLNKSF